MQYYSLGGNTLYYASRKFENTNKIFFSYFSNGLGNLIYFKKK